MNHSFIKLSDLGLVIELADCRTPSSVTSVTLLKIP